MLDALKSVEAVIAIILASSGLFVGVASWWDGRAKRHAAVALKASNDSAELASTRFQKVEERLDKIEHDAHRTKNELQAMQVVMAKLADKNDVARLSERTAASEGHLLRLSGQVDTIYRAILEAPRE